MNVFTHLNDPSVELRSRLDVAWAVLHDDASDPRSEDRVAAKCWLTYRLVDGALPLDRWEHVVRVLPPYQNADGLEVRWRLSQLTAEMYLHGLTRHHLEDLRVTALAIHATAPHLWRWPASILNYLRGMSVLALLSPVEQRGALVEQAMFRWQHVMACFRWDMHPMRFVELRDDLSALWQLIAIAHSAGAVEYKPQPWLPKFCGGSDHFARLMRQLDAPPL